MTVRSRTRDALIEAAGTLFWRQGYGATGLTEILSQAGVTGGSLYYFFRRKEDLLLAILDRRLEDLDLQIFGPVEAAEADPIERVFGVLDFYRAFLESTHCEMGCPIGNLALELADLHPEVRQKLAQLFGAWCSRVRKYLEDARNQLPNDVDLEGLAQFVLTVMEGGLMQARTARRLEPFDAGVTNLRRYFDALQVSARSEDRRS